MATKKTKRKTMRRAVKGKRETGDAVSSLAARVLRELGDEPGGSYLRSGDGMIYLYVRQVRTLAASCLSQDQTKGKRKP